MAIGLQWLRVLKPSWWRRCKACGVRAAKCTCKRSSAALEQIFYLEDRKNRCGPRNFSHVSDTAITASTTSASGTVLSVSDEYRAPGDFYRSTQRAQSTSSTQTAMVRRNSGTIVPHSSNRYYNHHSTRNDDMGYGYNHTHAYNDNNGYYGIDAYDAPRQHHRPRRQLPPTRTTSNYSARREENLSIQVYNRRNARLARSSSRSSTRQSSSDSLVIRNSNSSSVRASMASDRLSVDNNMGSFNPRGRYYDGGYNPIGIQEDDDDAHYRLQGLLQLPSPASSTSTIMERPRYHPFY